MNVILRVLTVLLSGISSGFLYVVMLLLVCIEWGLSTLMATLDGIFDFVEYYLQDQYEMLMRALYGE